VSGLSGIAAGLLYVLGYAGMARVLVPVISNLGGHVVLGLASLATLPVLVGVLARDAGRSGRLGGAGYALSFVGAAALSVGNLTEGVFEMESGVVLFRVGLIVLTVGVVVLGFSVRRTNVLPAWAVWPLVVGWMAFLPVANGASVFSVLPYFINSLLAASTLGVGWVAVGYALWEDRGASAPQRTQLR
jgi:hypothetical protein